jgi:hypothetical protein
MYISDQKNINFGVPQGSILGPTLFLVYMSDLLEVNLGDAEMICYADDTVIIFKDPCWEGAYRKVEEGLTIVAD